MSINQDVLKYQVQLQRRESELVAALREADLATSADPVTRLTIALKNALVAARQSVEGKIDGGGCNMDTVYIRAKTVGMRVKEILAAAAAAGVRAYESDAHGSKCVFFGGFNVTNDQGWNRTTAMEAAAKVLDAAGFQANIYYRLD